MLFLGLLVTELQDYVTACPMLLEIIAMNVKRTIGRLQVEKDVRHVPVILLVRFYI